MKHLFIFLEDKLLIFPSPLLQLHHEQSLLQATGTLCVHSSITRGLTQKKKKHSNSSTLSLLLNTEIFQSFLKVFFLLLFRKEGRFVFSLGRLVNCSAYLKTSKNSSWLDLQVASAMLHSTWFLSSRPILKKPWLCNNYRVMNLDWKRMSLSLWYSTRKNQNPESFCQTWDHHSR